MPGEVLRARIPQGSRPRARQKACRGTGCLLAVLHLLFGQPLSALRRAESLVTSGDARDTATHSGGRLKSRLPDGLHPTVTRGCPLNDLCVSYEEALLDDLLSDQLTLLSGAITFVVQARLETTLIQQFLYHLSII